MIYDSTCDGWIYEPSKTLRRASSTSSITMTNSTVTTNSLSSSKSHSSSSSGAQSHSHQPVPNRRGLQRSLTLSKRHHGSFTRIFKHFWTCIKPRITDDYSSSRPAAAKEEKQGGSTNRRTAIQRVQSSPSSAMSPDVRDECLREAILYCNKSGKPLDQYSSTS